MEIEPRGLPIHADATVKIRPRAVPRRQLVRRTAARQPVGEDASPRATRSRITQTSDPVQLDQVLDALNTDTRANLQNFLIDYGEALTRKPDRAEERRTGTGSARRQRRAGAQQGLRRAARSRCAAARSSTRRSPAPNRTTSRNWSRASARSTAALNVHEQDLGELIVNFNTFFARARVAVGEPARDSSPSCRSSLTQHRRGPRRPRRVVPADARLRARHPAGRAKTPTRRSRRRCRGSNR